MKLIYYIVRDIIVILLALLAVYTITHKEEVVKVSVDSTYRQETLKITDLHLINNYD